MFFNILDFFIMKNTSENWEQTPVRIWIQILVRLCRLKKLDFDMKNLLYVGNTVCHKTYLRRYKSHYERLEIRFIC
jgi:hypothetical protein